VEKEHKKLRKKPDIELLFSFCSCSRKYFKVYGGVLMEK
jgi:hypothetical protein